MKICWDNLENLIYRSDRGDWQHTVNFYYEEVCSNCGEMFLKQKRSRIRNTLKGGKGGESWPKLVGYTIEDLKKHLEDQFTPGMTWFNYGRDGWEIDHRKPIALFDIKSYEDEEFKECWSLDNLRPLWASENRRRGAILGNKLRRITVNG